MSSNKELAVPIDKIDFDGASKRYSGKVRETFALPNRQMAIVVTDRVSVFDFNIGTIPNKGQVLNRHAAWWFEKLDATDIPHHLLAVPHPNVSVVQHATPIPIELVVRAYLTGTTTTSSWYAYQNHNRSICGITMPAGMAKNEKFPRPIFTPTTKADVGHDENISKSDIISRGLVSQEILAQAEYYALRMFELGQKIVLERDLILVDTKYEMGLTDDGTLIVIDEIHTADSSRYWRLNSYEERLALGQEPENIDKEFVRRMIIENGYDVNSATNPSRYFTKEISLNAAERYLQLYKQMTGNDLAVEEVTPAQVTALLHKLCTVS